MQVTETRDPGARKLFAQFQDFYSSYVGKHGQLPIDIKSSFNAAEMRHSPYDDEHTSNTWGYPSVAHLILKGMMHYRRELVVASPKSNDPKLTGPIQFLAISPKTWHLNRTDTIPLRGLEDRSYMEDFLHGALSVDAPLKDMTYRQYEPGATNPKYNLIRCTVRTHHKPRLTGPIQFVIKLLKTWHLSRADAILLLGFEEIDQSYVEDLLNGHAMLRGRDLKYRIAYLFRIRKTLYSLFRDEEVENDWLREPHEALDGQNPMDIMLKGSMENLLLVKEYVAAAAGR